MEIKDNRAEIRKNKQSKTENAQTCRVCGSKNVHTVTYNVPTMGCIEFLRAIISQLEDKVNELGWALNPDRMGQ